jgi:glycosyltransferase involved in cell wall biosynthesis
MNDHEKMTGSLELIKISVIIPALNEEKFLPTCLQSLNKQDFDLPYEIIVVDNNNSDRTAAVASELGALVVSEPRRGITWARQKGVEVARGEIIAYVDANTYVGADWLSQIYNKLQDAFTQMESDAPLALSAEMLSSLPADILDAIGNATINGDIEQLKTLIKDIAEKDPRLSDALLVLADHYEYDRLLKLLEESQITIKY